MFDLLKVAFGVRPSLDRQLSTSSTATNSGGMDVRYLDSSCLLEKMRPNARNPLEQLIGGCDMMVKLVKGWHLAEMLDLVQLQNKLIDTFRLLYLKFLNSRTHMPLDQESSVYLRNHLGTQTKVEKFLVDFYTGLTCYSNIRVEVLESLPDDIALCLRHRRVQLAVRGSYDDLIAIGDDCFKVIKSDKTQHTLLHVMSPIVFSSSTTHASLPSRRGVSSSALSPMCSPHSPPLSMPLASESSTDRSRGHRIRLSLPGSSEVFVSSALMPMVQSTLGPAGRPVHLRSTVVSGISFVKCSPRPPSQSHEAAHPHSFSQNRYALFAMPEKQPQNIHPRFLRIMSTRQVSSSSSPGLLVTQTLLCLSPVSLLSLSCLSPVSLLSLSCLSPVSLLSLSCDPGLITSEDSPPLFWHPIDVSFCPLEPYLLVGPRERWFCTSYTLYVPSAPKSIADMPRIVDSAHVVESLDNDESIS
ncbi:hypothetical protein EJ02DRAFT_510234 [Clathrospora elynae]|uniref:Uncharacterized protein n=1 Tax=Clathrospora elynae TaxID=706981 RepID=A0A6A5T0R6_9PLEO|nr:hypothetical protein EJ02DRAFT_510234 [Clathrospora elynae]